MSIWFTEPTMDLLNGRLNKNMTEVLEINFTAVGEDWLEATMPVNNKTTQPFDILHGGASCVLAETIASVASNFCVDQKSHYAVGLEINANHIKSANMGTLVTGKASILHKGKSTHVWEIKITNSDNQLVCASRMTMAIVKRD